MARRTPGEHVASPPFLHFCRFRGGFRNERRAVPRGSLAGPRRTLASSARDVGSSALFLASHTSTRSELTRWTVTPKGPLTSHQWLAAVTDAMVELYGRHHGRKPASAKSLLMDDELLACMLTGVYTGVEKTMFELGRQAVVKETRRTFYEALRETYIAEVQRLSGRGVRAFFANQHMGPDLETLLFLLGPPSTAGG